MSPLIQSEYSKIELKGVNNVNLQKLQIKDGRLNILQEYWPFREQNLSFQKKNVLKQIHRTR